MNKNGNQTVFDFIGTQAVSVDTLSLPAGLFTDCGTSVSAFPGFCDVHVHFREPGFSYKETMESGSLSAARGGYTCVCTMPNLNPVPDSVENLTLQLERIREGASILVLPYGSITKGEKGQALSDLEEMAPFVIAFSDDGRGVQSDELMAEAMKRAKALGKMIVAHCEVNALLKGGYIHDGSYARQNGHAGICSASEYEQIRRDLELVSQIGVSYHVCHISTKESVALIREAKKAGLDVSCETAPHYLTMNDSDLQEEGRYKMNPPIRDRSDQEALLEGICDGTIEMIATDHAPHSQEEKSRGLKDSLFGVVGLETAFPVLYTDLVKKGIISLKHLIDLMSINPRRRFGIPLSDDLTFWDLNRITTVSSADFLSKGKSTPFEGKRINGVCLATIYNGKTVYTHQK